MVTEVTINGGVAVTANFNGSSIAVTVSLSAPLNVIVQLGYGSDPTSIPHNLLTGRDAVDSHPISAITGLTAALATIPAPIGFTPENVSNKKQTLTNNATDYPSTAAVNRLDSLKQTDSPEFANTQITTLKDVTSGGVIADVEATWLGATAKNVLSYLQKLVSKVYAINARVGFLEASYLLRYVVPVDVAAINLTVDRYGNAFNFIEGDEINIVIKVSSFINNNRVNLRINNRSDSIYLWHSTLAPITFFPPVITTALNQNSIIKIELINNEAIISSMYRYSVAASSNSGMVAATTSGLNSAITSLYLYASSETIPAGTVIIVKKW